jgi:hypothetical protein
MRVGLALPLIAAGVFSSPDRAAAQIESARVKEGVAAYEALDYAGAVKHLEEAKGERLTVDESVLVFRTLAFAKVALGDETGARGDFESLLRIVPDTTLDRTISPRIRAVFEEARSRMPPPEKPAEVATSTKSPTVAPNPPRPIDLELEPSKTPFVERGVEPKSAPFYQRGWFWGVTGGVATAAIITGVLIAVLGKKTDGTLIVVPR